MDTAPIYISFTDIQITTYKKEEKGLRPPFPLDE